MVIIYEGHFQVGDKTYNNMLHLVLDFLEAEGLSSEEEFDRWWTNKVKPYHILFMMAMEREYKNIKKYFVRPLFQTKTTKINTNLNGSKFFPELRQRTLDSITLGGDFTKIALVDEYLENSTFELPEGIFHNIHFELNYMSDIIFHFTRISSLVDENQLEHDLQSFIEHFKPDSACSDENNSFHEMIQYCQSYAQSFLENRKELLKMWLKIAETLNIDLNTNRFFDIKQNITALLADPEKTEEFKKEKLVKPPSVPKKQPLPQALVEFSMIRFYHILSQAIRYAHFVEDISKSPDITK